MTNTITDKVSQITTDCVYRIATGTWAVGTKLPSLRQGTKLWNVDPMTVKRAYEALRVSGLVEIASRSGVYVRDNAPVYGLRKHLSTLDALYASVQSQISAETGLSVLGSFRYLAQLAEQRAAAAPECSFVECTAFQSKQLAQEVSRAINAPCAAVTLSDLVTGRRPVLPSDRVYFTTGFHHAEVSGFLGGSGPAVVQLTVKFSADCANSVVEAGKRFALFCLDSEQGDLIVDEVRALAGSPLIPARAASVAPEHAVAAVHETGADEAVLVSPSIWESLPPEVQGRPDVFAYEYGFDEGAVRVMASALGLPLGELGCPSGGS